MPFSAEIVQDINFVFSVSLTIGQVIPIPALVTRRLHDMNIAGWWAILIVPLFFGSFLGIVLWLFMALLGLIFLVIFEIIFSIIMVFICSLFATGKCGSSSDNFYKIFEAPPIPPEFWAMATVSLLVFMITTAILGHKGTKGDNRYGRSLKARINDNH